MTERISNRLGIPITATTFHKLGLDTLKKARNESLDVLEDTSKFVNQYFEKELLKQPETVKLLLEYFAYYLHIPANMDNFDSLGEAYAYERGWTLKPSSPSTIERSLSILRWRRAVSRSIRSAVRK